MPTISGETSTNPEIVKLWKYVERVEERFALLACGPELQHILHGIRMECNAGTSSSTPAAGTDSRPRPATTATTAPDEGSCTTDQVGFVVKTLEREVNMRFVKLVSVMQHEVVYVDKNSTTIPSFREERLSRMLLSPLLHRTRFLIVASPLHGELEAEARAKILTQWLINHGVNAKLIDRPWKYNFTLKQQDLRPVERPIKPEPTDLAQGVWVFRTEC